MNSFQSVKRKLKNKMVKKSAIIIDDKPIEYAAYADDKDTKLPKVKVKSEHESLFASPGKANAIDTTYIKQQLFNKPPEDIDINHNSSINMSSFNKYVEDSVLHQGLVHKKQPNSEYVYTEKQQLQHPESNSYTETNEKVVLPMMPTALIASTDILSLPEPDKDVLLVELQKTAEQAQYEAYVAIQEGEKNLQALEQACDLINYFHTQLHQVKSQKELKLNQTTTLLRSSLPGNIRQLEPNRIGMGLVNKPVLPSVRYNTLNIEKNINDEIKYQQSKTNKVHATLNEMLLSLSGKESKKAQVSSGKVVEPRPDWEILGIYDTSSEAQSICDEIAVKEKKLYEKVQIRFDISNRKWIAEGKVVTQPAPIRQPTKRGGSVPVKLTRRSLSNSSRISQETSISNSSNNSRSSRPSPKRRSHSSGSSKYMKKSSYNQHALRSTIYVIPENMKRTRPVPYISSSFQTVKYPTPLRGPRISKQKRNLVIKSKVNARKINPYMAAADATLDALLTASFNRKLKL